MSIWDEPTITLLIFTLPWGIKTVVTQYLLLSAFYKVIRGDALFMLSFLQNLGLTEGALRHLSIFSVLAVLFFFPSCLSIKWPLIISLFISVFILVMANATLTIFFIIFFESSPYSIPCSGLKLSKQKYKTFLNLKSKN